MEREKSIQLELFSQEARRAQERSDSPRHPLFYVRGYERVILTIISVLIAAVISFSLGVEKGKRIASLKQVPVVEPAIIETKTKQDTAVTQQVERIEEPRYTIQLASYKTRSYAEREAEGLRKKGLSPLIVKKGDYMVLCVGKFSDKDNARPLLAELRKRYQGCYIRGL